MNKQPVRFSEIARVFLKIGAMSYGGPAIMGIMQTEIQEKRLWVDKEKFVEGLALVNLLPGPGATQLAIFIGHAMRGIVGGILAGACFIVPAFAIMFVLASLYAAFGTLPAMRNAFYGIGPVVVGIFTVAIFRLAKATIKDRWQIAIGVATVAAMLWTPAGLVMTLLAAGCVGVALFHAPRVGLLALLLLAAAFMAVQLASTFAGGASIPVLQSGTPPADVTVWRMGAFFLKVGAFTFGGGLSMLAFIEQQVVHQFDWLSPQEFVDGLALGQLTPGPILMLAAFIGFKLFGTVGATVAATAIFLPSFLMILSILPLLRRMKDLQWLKAFMRGIGPAVIGALAVSVIQMAPHAAPDVFTSCILALTIALMLVYRAGALPFMAGGAAFGLVTRGRAWDLIQGLMR